jgi:hypothetical protein
MLFLIHQTEFRVMQIPRLLVWQQWLLHALLIWMVSELSDSFTYWYEINTVGNYLFNEDGSAVTLWQRFVNHNYYQAVWLVVLIGTLMVELNYHFVFRTRPLSHFIASNFLFSLVFAVVLMSHNQLKYGSEFHFQWVPSIVLTAYGFAYAIFRDFVDQRLNRAQQKIQLVEAELATLKAQINPHFFFNTLNTLYGTALSENADKTAQYIEQMSNIMRYAITEAQRDFTSVEQEFRFIEDYLHLQKMRLAERDTIQVQTDLFYDRIPAKIAPFILAPFIENAFKYGIRVDRDCFIKLELRIQNRMLDMSIENSMFPLKPEQAGLGTGIRNTQKRLQIIYPDRHQLTYGAVEDIYTLRLQIHLN